VPGDLHKSAAVLESVICIGSTAALGWISGLNTFRLIVLAWKLIQQNAKLL